MNKPFSKLCKSVIAAATIGFLGFSAPAQAVPVTVDFTLSFGGIDVTGTIFGLDNDDSNQPATSLIASSTIFGGFTSLEFVPSGANNLFSFSSSREISFIDFIGTAADDSEFQISLPLNEPRGFALMEFGPTGGTDSSDFPSSDFSTNPVSAVPIPPAGVLFGSGLVVLAAMRRRAKKQATA